MANLKEIRTRIASVNSTRQITSAMKMVSAAKLRRAQDTILQMRPYANKLHEILSHISGAVEIAQDNLYAQNREKKNILIIAVSSNRGLCGAFNSNVFRKLYNLLCNDFAVQYRNKTVDIICIGRKVADLCKSKQIHVKETYHELFDQLSFDNIVPVAESVMKSFASKSYDQVIFVYNQFKNAAVQLLTVENFLPISMEEQKNASVYKSDYIFEPNRNFIVDVLIPKSLKIQFYKVLLDSNASEQGARMTAMHKATDNASDMLHSLRINYNKARQFAITNEILEIVGGAEALKG